MGCHESKSQKKLFLDLKVASPHPINMMQQQQSKAEQCLSKNTLEKTPNTDYKRTLPEMPKEIFDKIQSQDQQQKQISQLSGLIPNYNVTIDFINARKDLRTEQDEPIPILSEDFSGSHLMIKRNLHKKLVKAKLIQLNKCDSEIQKPKSLIIDQRLKNIYDLE